MALRDIPSALTLSCLLRVVDCAHALAFEDDSHPLKIRATIAMNSYVLAFSCGDRIADPTPDQTDIDFAMLDTHTKNGVEYRCAQR